MENDIRSPWHPLGWEAPTPEEIREVGGKIGRGETIADLLGLGKNGARRWRRWAGGNAPMTYATWRLLCELAGEPVAPLPLPEGDQQWHQFD